MFYSTKHLKLEAKMYLFLLCPSIRVHTKKNPRIFKPHLILMLAWILSYTTDPRNRKGLQIKMIPKLLCFIFHSDSYEFRIFSRIATREYRSKQPDSKVMTKLMETFCEFGVKMIQKFSHDKRWSFISHLQRETLTFRRWVSFFFSKDLKMNKTWFLESLAQTILSNSSYHILELLYGFFVVLIFDNVSCFSFDLNRTCVTNHSVSSVYESNQMFVISLKSFQTYFDICSHSARMTMFRLILWNFAACISIELLHFTAKSIVFTYHAASISFDRCWLHQPRKWLCV